MSSGSAGKLAWCAGITAAESAYIRVYMDGWVRARSLMRSCVRRACAFACACPPQHHHTTTLQVHAPYVPLHAPPPTPHGYGPYRFDLVRPCAGGDLRDLCGATLLDSRLGLEYALATYVLRSCILKRLNIALRRRPLLDSGRRTLPRGLRFRAVCRRGPVVCGVRGERAVRGRV